MVEGPQEYLRTKKKLLLTRWHSILTSGLLTLGLQSETVPFAWPSCMTPFQGLARMTSQLPSRVRCCATMRPVLVSCMRGGRQKVLALAKNPPLHCRSHLFGTPPAWHLAS
jgi:hypothetical protein